MAKFSTENLRNIGVIGHGSTGKTTLVSACLFTGGAENRLGRVEEGHAPTDFDEEEIARQISIQLAVAHTEWKGQDITFIDTPGYAVFRADTKASVRISDGAAIVVDATSGTEVMTEKVWEYIQNFKVPSVFVINRLDRDNSSFDRALQSCVDSFGREVVPVQLPLGKRADFEGVVDLLDMKAYRYEKDGDGKGKAEDIPAEFQDEAQTAHEALIEMIAESDEELMELYFEAGDLTPEQLEGGLKKAVQKMRLFPVFCLSASHNIGTDRLLDAMVQYLPSPAERQQPITRGEDGNMVFADTDPDGPFAGLVFKTMADPFAGTISLVKVFSGTAGTDSTAVNHRTGNSERLNNLFIMHGKQHQNVDDVVVAGQICAIAKLKDTATSDTLHAKGHDIEIRHVNFPQAAISFAVEPESQSDEEKIGNALHRLLGEDPTLRLDRDAQTGELLLSGLGQLHVEVTCSKMKRRFGVSTKLHAPKVPYRETIRRPAEAEGRHKKQSGGRGQFGVCKITIGPLERGAGFVFEDKIFGGSISQSFRPAVEKGIVEAAARGVIAGFPVVDFKATLIDGKEHAVDSSEIAFKIAGSLAFKEAVQNAAPVLLEPVMIVEVDVPDENTGDVIGDLNSRRGRVLGMDPRKGRQQVNAQIPLSEVLTYAVDLNSLTGGRGSYTMEFSHYDEVPPNVAQKIVEEARRAAEEDD